MSVYAADMGRRRTLFELRGPVFGELVMAPVRVGERMVLGHA